MVMRETLWSIISLELMKMRVCELVVKLSEI